MSYEITTEPLEIQVEKLGLLASLTDAGDGVIVEMQIEEGAMLFCVIPSAAFLAFCRAYVAMHEPKVFGSQQQAPSVTALNPYDWRGFQKTNPYP